MKLLIPFFVVLFLLVGCSISENLKGEQVIAAFKAENLSLPEMKTFNAETDPNKLLGRPNQYVEKIQWGAEPSYHSIEVFSNVSDMENRKKYVETVTKSASILAQYQFSYKNVLLRIHHDVTPDEAAKYEKALKSL